MKIVPKRRYFYDGDPKQTIEYKFLESIGFKFLKSISGVHTYDTVERSVNSLDDIKDLIDFYSVVEITNTTIYLGRDNL